MASHIKQGTKTASPADLGTYLTEIINEKEKATCIKMSRTALFIIMENWTSSNSPQSRNRKKILKIPWMEYYAAIKNDKFEDHIAT